MPILRAGFLSRHNRSTRLRLESLDARALPAPIGVLDPSFGTAGKVVQSGIPFNAIATEPDGKIVAVGTQNNDFAIVRYNPDGILDTSFSSDGIQTFAPNLGGGNNDQATGVAIQQDGRIVVVGTATTVNRGDDFVIARLNPNGSLDTTFGTAGSQDIDFAGGGTNDDVAHAVAIAGNGDIYVVGTTATGAAKNGFAIAALSPSGSELTGFGTNGHEFINFSGATDDGGNGIAIQPDGKLVIVGSTNSIPADGFDMVVIRLDPTTGALDNTFNIESINFGAAIDDFGNAVALQADGKIVVAGQSLTTGIPQAAAALLNPDGSLDASFGAGGLKSVDFGGNPGSANRVLIQPTGQIVLIGSNSSDTVVARLLETR